MSLQLRHQGLWEGCSAGTSVGGPKSQEGARESLKALANDVLFWFFHYLFWVFSTQIHNCERVSACPRGPRAVLFRLARFLLEVLFCITRPNWMHWFVIYTRGKYRITTNLFLWCFLVIVRTPFTKVGRYLLVKEGGICTCLNQRIFTIHNNICG